MSLSPCTVTPLGLREDPEILPYYRPRPRLGTWQRAEWLKKSSHRSDPPSIGGTHHVTPMTRATGLGEALGTRRLGFTNSNQSSGLYERKKKMEGFILSLRLALSVKGKMVWRAPSWNLTSRDPYNSKGCVTPCFKGGNLRPREAKWLAFGLTA